MNKILFICLIALTISSIDLEKFREDILKRHNALRAKHQVGPLTRYSELESLAQKHSEYMAKNGYLKQSGNKLNNEYIGENLCSSTSPLGIGKACVNLWYKEEEKHDYSNEKSAPSSGHFAQMVWKKTNRIGCGVDCDSSNKCFVACNYYPAGNYYNQYKDNVLPKKNVPEVEEEEEDDTPDSSKVTDKQLEQFRKDVLARHNFYRAQHNAKDLVRSAKLENIAQATAEYMLETNKFQFPKETYNDENIGSSLFYYYSSPFDGNSITDKWYDENEKYNFKNPGFIEDAGGFTQLVWRSSKKIGCGYACKGVECYGICSYYPPGNMKNEFEKNVFPKTS